MDRFVVNNDEFFGNVIEILEEGKQVTIPVKGFSMLPFIRGEKDQVVLEKPSRAYRVGDIVLFRLGGRYIMHRIIALDGDRVTIMGDGVPGNTEKVRLKDLIALATCILRDGTKKTDPYAPRMMRKVRLWRKLLPVRRYLLFIYRWLPWNRVWLKPQYRQVALENKQKQETI